MSLEKNSDSQFPAPHDSRGLTKPDGGRLTDLLSPELYELLVWGFTERNGSGEWVLRRDIQSSIDGSTASQTALDQQFGSPLFVGYRCQPCWEAAVTLVAYGRHLCPDHDQSIGWVGNGGRS